MLSGKQTSELIPKEKELIMSYRKDTPLRHYLILTNVAFVRAGLLLPPSSQFI